ncbi:MAG: hypothetical protein LBH30_04755 [Prevotellaceae bacterium]|jgi:hypothetical protein|nr:hypothetical protein [Prevotellaceae bacterium]
MKYKIFIITVIFSVYNTVFAQINIQNELNKILSTENVEQRIILADTFCVQLAKMIRIDATAKKIDAPKRISQLFSKDKTVGIYTWSIPAERGIYKYYGIIKSPKGIFILQDVNINSENIANKKLTSGAWYGAVYYDIIETNIDGKNAYTLLGNNLQGILSNRKIIDVLSFDDEKPVFGADIFENQDYYRLIFEYNARSSMHLVYEKDRQMIIYSLLVPINPMFEGDYRFYVSDTSCDGLIYKNGKWTLVEGVPFERGN